MQRAIKILCTICWLSFSIKGLAQEKTDLGRITEVIAYPLRDLSFVSPRFDRTNYKNGSFFDNYTLRTVITTNGKNHFRLDIPISKTNATPNPNLYILIDGIFFRYLFYLIISNEIEFNK